LYEFSYSMPTTIITGHNCVVKNSRILRKYGQRCLIVTGFKSSKLNGSLEDCIQALENEDIKDMWEVIRVRTISGRRMILDKDYFYTDVVQELTEEICRNSIYDYLETQVGLKIGFAHKEIVIEKATDEDRKNLDLLEYDVVDVVNTLVYLDNGKLFQFTQSRHCPDKFRFIDVARRVRP